MNNQIDSFDKTAQKLSRNPLGIIALFIVLVYGMAALALGLSSGNLQIYERLPLIYFLVIFPVVVLAVFYRLVSHHHVKLYAPSDFQDQEGFFRTLLPHEQKEKLDADTKIIKKETEITKKKSQKTKKRKAPSTITNVAQSTNVLAIVVEDLVFRELALEFNGVIRKGIGIQNYRFDGAVEYMGNYTVIEVKYTQRLDLGPMLRRQIVRFRAIRVKKKMSFLLAIVADGWTPKHIVDENEKLRNIAQESNLPLQIRIYDLAELERKYGID